MSPAADATLVMSGLGPQTVAVGAASLVLKEALANPRLFPVAPRLAKAAR